MLKVLTRDSDFKLKCAEVSRNASATETNKMQACCTDFNAAEPNSTACYVGQNKAKPIVSLETHCEDLNSGDTTTQKYLDCKDIEKLKKAGEKVTVARKHWRNTLDSNYGLLLAVEDVIGPDSTVANPEKALTTLCEGARTTL